MPSISEEAAALPDSEHPPEWTEARKAASRTDCNPLTLNLGEKTTQILLYFSLKPLTSQNCY